MRAIITRTNLPEFGRLVTQRTRESDLGVHKKKFSSWADGLAGCWADGLMGPWPVQPVWPV